jgi:DNA-binding MarR family transcriptional regulator
MTMEARILRKLAEGDAPNVEELAKRVGMRKDAVGMAIKEMQAQGSIVRGERGLSLVPGMVLA